CSSDCPHASLYRPQIALCHGGRVRRHRRHAGGRGDRADRRARRPLRAARISSPPQMAARRSADVGQRHLDAPRDLRLRAAAAPPTLSAVLQSRDWRGLTRYAGSRDAEPVVWVQSILRHACSGPADPQTFLHADTFHPTVKAWLFLTDVAEDAGPFTYVPRSHRLTAERLEWERRMSICARHSPNAEDRQGSFRIALAELAPLGLPQPRIFAVPANTLIVADTFGFH